MRVGTIVVCALLAVAIAPFRAGAQTCTAKAPTGEIVEIPCQDQYESTTPGGPRKTYNPDELVTAISEVDGEFCTILATIASPQGRQVVNVRYLLEQTPTFGEPLHDIWKWIVGDLPGCPSLRPSPATVAWSFVKQASPPPSRPHIAPGYAITGKKAFLQTDGPTTQTQTFDTILGPLAVTFEASTFTVDWGDGAGIDSGPFDIPGRPYPDGEAAHVYTHAKAYDVVVRTSWTARWSVAGESGALGGLSRTERIDDFQARQLQAVRDR
jgi:hypothetical protein